MNRKLTPPFFFLLLLSFAISAPAVRADEEKDIPPPSSWEPAGEITPPAPTAGAEAGPAVPSPMFQYGQFQISAKGRVQVMGGLVGKDANTGNGDLLSRDGFRIHRARMGLYGQLMNDWHYSLELALIDEYYGGNNLLDANITWKPAEWLWIRAGAGKPGFSRALITSSGSLQFIERPLWVNLERATRTTMLDLNRQVGVAVGGRLSMFFYEAGVYNGSPGVSKTDLNDGMLYLLRLGVGQGDIGENEADFKRNGFRWRLALNGYINQDSAAEFRGAGVDTSIKYKGISFHAEALWAKQIPNDRSQDIVMALDKAERWGMYAQAGYMLPFDFLDLEVAVRFEIMDDWVGALHEDEGDIWELTAGVSAYFSENRAKLMVNYVRREEMHGTDLSNDMLAAMLQLKF